MDAIAGLAFGIIVVQVIRDLGGDDPTAVAGSTVRAGIFSCLLMAFIYIAVTIAGAQSRGDAKKPSREERKRSAVKAAARARYADSRPVKRGKGSAKKEKQ